MLLLSLFSLYLIDAALSLDAVPHILCANKFSEYWFTQLKLAPEMFPGFFCHFLVSFAKLRLFLTF